MPERPIDLRSDTVTLPTAEMRKAIAEAELGDDVYGEDPTIRRLEELAAERMGKEAAVLVTSGTQGNLVGVLSHTQRGDEVIVGEQAHILHYEVAGCAVVGAVQLRPLRTVDGMFDLNDIQLAIRPGDLHSPRTAALCIENTHNRQGGAVLDASQVKAIASIAHAANVPVHLDGARVFNAAAALGVPVSALTADVDSVTFCLSKGLSAPVGSVLCGKADYIQTARRYRKILGGGMRQGGIIAAAGIVALNTMVDRLPEDHSNARVLAEGLAEIPGIKLSPEKVRTNIVIFDATASTPIPQLIGQMRERGLLCGQAGPGRIRMVTHYGISRPDVERAVAIAREVFVGVPVGAR